MLNRCQFTAFVLETALFVILIRTTLIVLFPLLFASPLGYVLLSDNIHHYHAGMALIILSIAFRGRLKRHFLTCIAFCLALLLEEYLVIVYELGVPVPYTYLSFQDNLVVYSLAIFCALSAFVMRWYDRHT